MIGSHHRVSFLWNTTAFRNEAGPAGAPGLPEPLWNGQIQAWDTEAYRVSARLDHLARAWSTTSRGPRTTFTKNSYSANVDKNWKDKVCIKNVVDCNQNFPVISFTEFTYVGRDHRTTEPSSRAGALRTT